MSLFTIMSLVVRERFCFSIAWNILEQTIVFNGFPSVLKFI